jgi:hypothetical protein
MPVTLTNIAVYKQKHREHIKMRKQAAKSGLKASSIAPINL